MYLCKYTKLLFLKEFKGSGNNTWLEKIFRLYMPENRCLINIPVIFKERNFGGEWKIFGARFFIEVNYYEISRFFYFKTSGRQASGDPANEIFVKKL